MAQQLLDILDHLAQGVSSDGPLDAADFRQKYQDLRTTLEQAINGVKETTPAEIEKPFVPQV